MMGVEVRVRVPTKRRKRHGARIVSYRNTLGRCVLPGERETQNEMHA